MTAEPVPTAENPGQNFARVIRNARAAKDWTMQQLADASGVSLPAIQRWEAGHATHPDPDQVRAVCLALGIDPRRAAIALGFLSPDEVGTILGHNVPELLTLLRDPSVDSAAKAVALETLRASMDLSRRSREQAGLRLDEEILRLIQELAMSRHETPAQYVAALVRSDYERLFPGRLARQAESGPRPAPLREALGWPEIEPDPDVERRMDQMLADVDRQAQMLYGESPDRTVV